MTSWSRRVSSAAHREALRDGTPHDDQRDPSDPSDQTDPSDTGGPTERSAAVDVERGLSGQQVRSILTDTLVETPDMVAIFASVGREALWANDAFVTLIPIRQADEAWLVELLDEWSRGHYEVKVLPALVKFGRWRGRLTFVSDDGPVPVSAVVVAHRNDDGDIATVSLVARDLSELRAAQEHVEASASRLAALVENATDLIAVVGRDGTIDYLSPAVSRILGHTEGELDGRSLLDLVHPDDRPAEVLGLARPDDQGISAPVELRLRAADGSWRYLEVVVTDLSENPAIGGVVLNARDVTDRVEAARAQANQAFVDPLTGLPNRVRLLDRVGSALLEPAATVAALVCDIDQFKPLNALIGPDDGDALLQEIARRLASVVGDEGVLARVGGDEFAVVASGSTDDAVALAERLGAAARVPVVVGDRTLEVTLSSGIAAAGPGDVPEVLVFRAEQAMARAKQQGGDQVSVHDAALAAVTNRRDTVRQQLDDALANDRVRVHFQPVFDIDADRVVGAEALLRIADDVVLLTPAEYVEAAESSGLITRLGLQVLQVTCEQLAEWSGEAVDSAPPEISVNVSPRQLADPDLPGQIEDLLAVAGVAPSRLCLEITESILISAQPVVDTNMGYLHSLGVRLGLDDFGTGQSSLGYLKRFPLDFVKIDQSLVAGLGVQEQDTAIVRATIELAHQLGLVVVAVGVETDEQLEALAILGCDRAQGYLFAPPQPADELLSWLATGAGTP